MENNTKLPGFAPAQPVFTVSEFNEYINTLVSGRQVKVIGEVSGYNLSQNKFVFFDLKDEEEEAKTSCFAFVWDLYKSQVSIVDGMRLIVTGTPRVSMKSGRFSIYVDKVEVAGEGDLKKALELLKAKLKTEGLFDISRKRKIARFPQRIGLVTSREAAAYTDFIKVLKNRFGGLEIYLKHVHVQGEKAIPDIVDAIKLLNAKLPNLDCLVVTRGGGSLDDLHAFNSEEVARAIFASKIPVICAVGHERDESICDFVADLRASTPSNAAELLIKHRDDIKGEILFFVHQQERKLHDTIRDLSKHIDDSLYVMEHIFIDKKERFKKVTHEFLLFFGQWQRKLSEQLAFLQTIENRLTVAFKRDVSLLKSSLEQMIRLLRSLSPEAVLKRGYSIVFLEEKVLKSSADVEVGQDLIIQPARGKITSRVTKKE